MSHEVFGFNVWFWPSITFGVFAKWRFGKASDPLALLSASVFSVILELAVIRGHR